LIVVVEGAAAIEVLKTKSHRCCRWLFFAVSGLPICVVQP
jgi:hypothetical protein